MKKILIFLFLIFLLPLAAGVEFESFKDSNSFSQGETLLTKFSGNFIDQPNEANIFFYRNHVKIPVVFEMEKISGEFYIYALLTGKSAGNYSVSLENVRYMNGTEISEESVVMNFSINDEKADFSLKPGFLKTSNNFNLEVQNLKSSPITISINTSEKLQAVDSTNVLSGETKKIEFELLTGEASEMIILSSDNTNYSVPVFIDSDSEIFSPEGERSFRFEPKVVEVSIPTNSDTKRIFYLVNTGEETIEDINLSVSPLLSKYIVISRDVIGDVDVNTTEKIEISVVSDAEEAVLEGKLFADTENLTTSLTIVLNFVKDFVPENEEEKILTTTCSDLKGEICGEGSECSEDPAFVKDGICCLGTCQQIEESSSGKFIGWFIIVVIFILVLWFFKKKFKGVKRNVDLTKIARGKR